jgi:hypothetical protein
LEAGEELSQALAATTMASTLAATFQPLRFFGACGGWLSNGGW